MRSRGVLCVISLILVLCVICGDAWSNERMIALTFDDGPRPEVLKVLLPLLNQYDAKGTFFVIGAVAKDNRDLLRVMVQTGHEIENHSYGHENLKKNFVRFGITGLTHSIEETTRIIIGTGAPRPRFFRPPFWTYTREIKSVISQLGYRVLAIDDPDINTLDYDDVDKRRPASALIQRVKDIMEKREKAGIYRHVFVFHELFLTYDALRTLLPYFQNYGYRLARLDEMV